MMHRQEDQEDLHSFTSKEKKMLQQQKTNAMELKWTEEKSE